MLLHITAIIAGFALLVWGAERFVTGAAAIARNLGVSPMLIGMTIVGFGTSAPEILVSAMASFEGNPGLAIGNAIGSNIANIGLILGVTALIAPLDIKSETLRREYPMLLAVCLVATVLMLDGVLGLVDAAILLACLFVLFYAIYLISFKSRGADPLGVEFGAEIPQSMTTALAVWFFIAGLFLLLVSSKILVWGAVELATAFGISDLVIGLTIVALGTSLPELAASVVSALKQEDDIAIGNILGSNMYNLLAVLPMPALIAPGPFAPEAMTRDMSVMIGFTLILFATGYAARGKGRIGRLLGLLLLSAFAAYQVLLVIQRGA